MSILGITGSTVSKHEDVSVEVELRCFHDDVFEEMEEFVHMVHNIL